MVAMGLSTCRVALGQPEPHVEVCVGIPAGNAGATLYLAKQITERIYAGIGVILDWQKPKHCPPGAIRIQWSTETSADDHPGALGYSFPFQGTRIVVLFDRIQAAPREMVPHLLGHVLAHEIGHMLEENDHHSPAGVLKAQWNAGDYCQMRDGLLSFTSDDVYLMRLGMADREKREVAGSAIRLSTLH